MYVDRSNTDDITRYVTIWTAVCFAHLYIHIFQTIHVFTTDGAIRIRNVGIQRLLIRFLALLSFFSNKIWSGVMRVYTVECDVGGRRECGRLLVCRHQHDWQSETLKILKLEPRRVLWTPEIRTPPLDPRKLKPQDSRNAEPRTFENFRFTPLG